MCVFARTDRNTTPPFVEKRTAKSYFFKRVVGWGTVGEENVELFCTYWEGATPYISFFENNFWSIHLPQVLFEPEGIVLGHPLSCLLNLHIYES